MPTPPLNSPLTFVTSQEALRQSSAWTENEWLCRPELVAAQQLLMVRATMPAGRCHPFHRHPHREEIIYVLSGVAEQWVDRERRMLSAGDIAHIPAGVVHGTYNTSQAPLVFLATLGPAVLGAEATLAADPQDVSALEPWASLRAGLPACTIKPGA